MEQFGFYLQLAVDVVQVFGSLDVCSSQLTETDECFCVVALSYEEPR
jgi:hypothetical protein